MLKKEKNYSNQLKKEKIRLKYLENEGVWYYSVIDVIREYTNTKDARNYWKVCKSRLSKTHPELVTNCNQLKLPSVDGKQYLTDTLPAKDILELLKIISPKYLKEFEKFFTKVEKKKKESRLKSFFKKFF